MYGDHRDLHVRPHPFPTRRSSDLGRKDQPIYPFEHAVERVRQSVAAARSAGDLVVTARAENFLHGRLDLEDTIARLKAFEAAGANVLFAPGLPDLEAIRAVCAAVSRPVSEIGRAHV